jgi:thiamine kinase
MTPEAALAAIGSLTDGAKITAELAGGPASRSYRVERDADRWVLRIDTPTAGHLELNRAAEAVILAHADAAGVGPRLAYIDVKQGLQLTHYIPGRAWSTADIIEPVNLKRLAHLLRRVHAIKAVGEPLALEEKAARYAERVGTAEARELAAEIGAAAVRLAQREEPQCLCHNDPICTNVIEGEGLYLIDWEYAAPGDPFFDLAVVAQHHAFNEAQSLCLLSAYRGEAVDADMRHLADYRALYAQLFTLWMLAVD